MKEHHLTTRTPIFLVGFMGSGKFRVGEALAGKLGRSLIDLDKRVEARTNWMVVDLVSSESEEHFRQLEYEALRKVAHAAGVIVILWGDAMACEENRELIKRAGISVWLDAPCDLCWPRMQDEICNRLFGYKEAEARAHYSQLAPFYQQSALHVEVSESQSAGEIADDIIRQLCAGESCL